MSLMWVVSFSAVDCSSTYMDINLNWMVNAAWRCHCKTRPQSIQLPACVVCSVVSCLIYDGTYFVWLLSLTLTVVVLVGLSVGLLTAS
jgi:hypothetical protein